MYLGIDLGTSGVKTILMDDTQQVLASHSESLTVSRPHDGWSEQQPEHWISAIEATLLALKATHPQAMAAVRGIGLSGQMHGATLLDHNDQVLRPCMLWNDTRSHAQAARMDTATSRSVTGNILFPGFTAPKVQWVADNEPDLFKQVRRVLLPKDYARLWLTGESVTDLSDASGTGWLDVGGRSWSAALLNAYGLNEQQMPSLVEGTAVSGTLRRPLAEQFGLSERVVVAGGAGDNAAAACGMGTVEPGRAFLSLGTSGVLFAATNQYQPNADSAVHAFCHALPDTWHQMGVILAATDALNWLSIVTGKAPAALTAALEDTTAEPVDVLFLPYLGGERTPINDAAARGVLTGLSHHTDTAAMTRAVLQGVAFAFRDCQGALAAAGTTLQHTLVTGGGAKSRYWLQVLSSVLQTPLYISDDGDYGAGLGAARLGLLAAEKSAVCDICTLPSTIDCVEPDPQTADAFEALYQRYRQTYQTLSTLAL